MSDLRDVRRFVAFSPVGYRGELWAISFNQYPVERRVLGDVTQHRGIWKCKDP